MFEKMMLDKLPTDIRQYIQENFSQSEIDEIGDRWQTIYKKIGTHHLRAIIYLAAGQADFIDTYLKADQNSIISWAENDDKNKKIRDFNKTFQENGLL